MNNDSTEIKNKLANVAQTNNEVRATQINHSTDLNTLFERSAAMMNRLGI